MHDRIDLFVTDLPRYAEGENSFDYQFILGKKTCYLEKIHRLIKIKLIRELINAHYDVYCYEGL